MRRSAMPFLAYALTNRPERNSAPPSSPEEKCIAPVLSRQKGAPPHPPSPGLPTQPLGPGRVGRGSFGTSCTRPVTAVLQVSFDEPCTAPDGPWLSRLLLSVYLRSLGCKDSLFLPSPSSTGNLKSHRHSLCQLFFFLPLVAVSPRLSLPFIPTARYLRGFRTTKTLPLTVSSFVHATAAPNDNAVLHE